MSGSRLPGLAAGFTAASIWGGMYVVSDVILETIPPFTLLTLRILLGLACLAVVLLWRRTGVLPSGMGGDRRRWILAVLFTGWVGYGISLGLQFTGTDLSTAANGAMITAATPAFVALFAQLLLGERLTPGRAAALVLAMLGVLLVVDVRGARFVPDTFWGNLILFGAALTWGLYSVLVRRDSREGDLVGMTALGFLGGLLMSVPVAAWEMAEVGIGRVTAGTIWGVLYLGIVSTAVAMFLWNFAFARLPASTAGLTFFAQPLVGVGLSAWLLGETPGMGFFVGGGMILVSVVLATRAG